jgi:SOS-response transcriptional repressor LexA
MKRPLEKILSPEVRLNQLIQMKAIYAKPDNVEIQGRVIGVVRKLT